jgi:preprotein translocase subunit SecF
LKFAEKPPIEKIRSALAPRLPGGAPEIQEVTGTNEVIVGTEMRDERELDQARRVIVDTLASTFGQGETGKLEFNNASQQAIVDRLRGPLLQSGLNLGEEQLQDLVANIIRFRTSPPQSGLIRSFDQLTGVPGVNSQVVQTLKQEATLAPYSIRGVEIVGPKMGAELRQQAIYVVLAALAGMLIYIAFRFEWIYGVAAVLAVFHDTVITIGMFSLLNKEISLTVVAALLTLVGYSMNDTIVRHYCCFRQNSRESETEQADAVCRVGKRKYQSDVEPNGVNFGFDISDGSRAMAIRRAGSQRVLACVGNWNYHRYLFIGLHRKSDSGVLV